jgi:hypothetical protein
MTTLLTESAIAPTKTDSGNWRAVLITPGKGSSGVYTEAMLKESGPVAFPKGTHSYIDHPVAEGEVRSPKNLMGVLAEDAYYDEETGGLVAELQVMPHWKEFVEAVAPHTGLSIYAMGEGSYNENNELVVESLTPHTQNSVDLVSYAGRPGSGLAEKLYESALAAFDSSKVDVDEAEAVPTTNEGNPNMDEIKAMIAELPGLIAASVVEALDARDKKDNTDNMDPAMESDPVTEAAEIAEAMLEAALPEVSRKAVYEALRNGVEVAVAIEAQKAFVESVMSHLKEAAETAAPAATVEETVVVNSVEAAPKLSDILKIKVG